jgi:hypothetical protein
VTGRSAIANPGGESRMSHPDISSDLLLPSVDARRSARHRCATLGP